MPPMTPARVRVSCAAVLLAVAGGLAGCGDGASDETLRVESAASKLGVISSLMSQDERTQAYNQIVTDLQSVESPAASLLAAQATAGLGEIELERANVRSAEALATIGAMRGRLESYVRLRSFERAVASQDLSAQIAALDSDAQELSDRLNTTEAQLRAVDAEIGRLVEEREQRLTVARGLREEAIGLRDGIEGLSAGRRQSTLDRVREIERRSDRLEAEASGLRIDIGDAEMRKRMVLAELELLQGSDAASGAAMGGDGLIRSNAESRGKTTEIENQLRQERQKLRTRVGESRDALVASYEELVSTYRSEAEASFESALSRFGQAASAAQRATSGVQSARSAVAQFRAFEATAHVSRAGVESAIAELGRDLSAVLDDAGGVPGMASAFEESARSALQGAADAYDGAGSLLDDASERADAIRASLGMDTGLDQGADMDRGMDGGTDTAPDARDPMNDGG